MTVARGQGCLDRAAIVSTGWAAAVFESGHRDRPDAPTGVSPALRQTEGFVRSIFDCDPRRSRRARPHDAVATESVARLCEARSAGQRTAASDRRRYRPLSGGPRRVGRRETCGHGTRGWKKLHVGVDGSGVIVAYALTESTVAFSEAAGARHAQVVVPPIRTAKVSRHGPRSSVRDRTISDVETRWRSPATHPDSEAMRDFQPPWWRSTQAR